MDTRPLRVTAAALRDLVDIKRYTTERWGRAQWLEYFAGIEAVFERMQQEPFSGREMAGMAAGLRSMVYRSHLVFFHVNARDEVVVLRVLHARQNAAALQWEDEMEGVKHKVGPSTHFTR